MPWLWSKRWVEGPGGDDVEPCCKQRGADGELCLCCKQAFASTPATEEVLCQPVKAAAEAEVAPAAIVTRPPEKYSDPLSSMARSDEATAEVLAKKSEEAKIEAEAKAAEEAKAEQAAEEKKKAEEAKIAEQAKAAAKAEEAKAADRAKAEEAKKEEAAKATTGTLQVGGFSGAGVSQ